MNKLHLRGFTGAACLLIAFCGALPAFANCGNSCFQFSTITFSVPGAGFTRPTSINSSGAIAGVYGSSDGGTLGSGFVRDPDGTITTFLGPGGNWIMWGGGEAAAEMELDRRLSDAGVYINDSGVVAGSYGIWTASGYVMHGFVGNPKGKAGLVSFDPPGSIYTEVRDINSLGWVTGTFWDGYAYNQAHGFLYVNGTSYIINVPGAYWTTASSVTSQGDIVGDYAAGPYPYDHSYLCQQPCYQWSFGNLFFNGVTFGPPAGFVWWGNPIEFRSNSVGKLAGTLKEIGTSHLIGYVGDTQGNSTSFKFPGALNTNAFGINTSGSVVGWYGFGLSNSTHAFLRDPTGSFFNIDPPGSSFAFATAINDAGVIIGVTIVGVTNELGFVTTPLH